MTARTGLLDAWRPSVECIERPTHFSSPRPDVAQKLSGARRTRASGRHDLLGMRLLIFAIIGAVTAAGCTRRAPVDVMMLPGVCDSVPASVAPGARRAARIPHVAGDADHGAVVGILVEAGTGQPPSYGDASLRPLGATGPTIGPVRADTLGGFALEHVPPGAYTLRLRAFNHQYQERHIEARAGAVDTVRAELRYYVCLGY